jgi:hypothetical protein
VTALQVGEESPVELPILGSPEAREESIGDPGAGGYHDDDRSPGSP